MQLPSPEILASWPVPNYDNPTTRGNGVLIVTSILFPLVLSMIFIRLYTRLVMSKSFGLDDWLIIAAMVPSTTFAILAILAERKFHFNRHIWDVPFNRVTFGLQYIIVTQIVFTLGQTLTKCSMLALYYRILSSGRRFKMMTIAASIIIAVQGLIFILVTIFQCRPPSHYWLITFASQPECINETLHVTVAGTINTVTDCIVVLFPIPKMLQLQISHRQRLIIIFLFGAGFLVCVAGAVRTYYTYVELVSSDMTWDTYYVWISSTVELYVGIIGASVPATKPFFTRYIPFILPHSLHSSRSDRYAISSADKGPFSGSTTVATPRASRTLQKLSNDDLELGDVREWEIRTTRCSRNLDAIEEIGSDASISSFTRMAAEGERRKSSDECRSDEIGIGKRDSDTRPRSEDTFRYTTNSKDEAIDEGDLGMAAHYKPRYSV
ncbi:putative integral membrane protein [Botrytis fragariae]|uniref:Putative integral membrane protein n=1 Tax=Botrytis fragariae TaxID=1964551 RepID=A0A8H6EP67_9HELO|nr:putative integral membrane protein [Botrytis fragariae]KAF5879329.1 putative integral membrane protein [Botrytis fragariae]